MLTPGTILQGRYRVVRKLAQGGMGTVYEAMDERLDTRVALKETAFDDEALRAQFEREARLLARLHHHALPRVSDHFNEGEGQFLVMQFIGGDDLEAMRRERGGSFPATEVLAWADQLLDALDYLHTQQPPIIHRDIKPQNLKLGERGQIMLLDFGLAKGYASSTSPLAPAASLVGYTPAYAPLEQMNDEGTDARSDIYGLAATLYHLLTSVTPPDARTRNRAVINGEPDPLRPADELSAQVSAEVAAVLRQAMALRRDQRISKAAAMRRALREADKTPSVRERVSGMTTVAISPQGTDPAPDDVLTLQDSPSDPEDEAQVDPTNLSETQKHHLDYWTAFRKHVERRGSFIAPPIPKPQHVLRFSIGRSDFGFDVYKRILRDKWIGVGLVLGGNDAKPHFHILSREREQIEREIGATLEWQEKPSQKNCIITLRRLNADPTDKQEWPRQHEWLLEKLEAFHRAFAPRIKNLRTSDYVSGAASEVAAPQSAKPVSATPAHVPEKKSGRSLLTFGSLATLLLMGVVGVVLMLTVFRKPDESGLKVTGTSATRPTDVSATPSATDTTQAGAMEATSTDASEARLALKGHDKRVQSAVFSPDGKLIASGGDDETIKLWDAQSGALKQTVPGFGSSTRPLAFSLDGQTLVVALNYVPAANECSVALLDARSGKLGEVKQKIKALRCPLSSAALSPDGTMLATGANEINIWDARTGELKQTLEGHGVVTDSLAFSPSGAMLASAGHVDGSVKLWDVSGGKLRQTIKAHESPTSVAFSPDGATLATGGYEGKLKLWNTEGGAPRQTLDYDAGSVITTIAFSLDGRLLACGGNAGDGQLKVWDAQTGTLKAMFKVDGVAESVVFSPDSQTLACGTSGGATLLFDLSDKADARRRRREDALKTLAQ